MLKSGLGTEAPVEIIVDGFRVAFASAPITAAQPLSNSIVVMDKLKLGIEDCL
jgi:hypothetical protein